MLVNTDRLWADIERNAEFGQLNVSEGHGRTALTATTANRNSRDYLVDRMKDAGLSVTIDAVGNIAGTWYPKEANPEAAPIAAGSHLDSVPEGGIFDGPLGVYAALEVIRVMQETNISPNCPVTVVSFTEEEGARFGEGLLGSAVATKEETVESALARKDDDGKTLKTALAEIGYQGEGIIDAASWDAWFELHVEQNTRLEAAGVPVGVVTDITGITYCEAEIKGVADHAGATPMDARTDGLAAASEFILDMESASTEAAKDGEGTAVGTVGSLSVTPNTANVVPGQVTMGIDVRSVTANIIERIIEAARESLVQIESTRDVETNFERPWHIAPTPMNDYLRTMIHQAGETADIETMDLYSEAAHDTMHIANVSDAALLFAPSQDGISHSPKEWTDPSDCATATRVLAGAMAKAAGVDIDE